MAQLPLKACLALVGFVLLLFFACPAQWVAAQQADRLVVDSPLPDEEIKTPDYVLKAHVPNHEVSSYSIVWYVDPKEKHEMEDNADLNIKYYNADFKKWTWHSSRRYEITFAAKDRAGRSLGAQAVPIRLAF